MLDIAQSLAALAAWEPQRFALLGLEPKHFPPGLRPVVLAAAEAHRDLPRGKLADVTAVAAILERSKAPETRALGQAVLMWNPVSRSQAEAAAAKLREESARQAARDGLARLLTASAELGLPELSSELSALSTSLASSSPTSTKNARSVIEATYKMLVTSRDKSRMVDVGLRCWQQCVGPLPVGSLTVVAGDTNVGKSSIVLAMLMAAQAHAPAGYVSLEDGEEIVGSRLLGALSGVSSRHILQGRLDRDDYPLIAEAVKEIPERIHFEFPANGTDTDVCLSMSRLAMHGCKLVVVDYVQAISAAREQQDRRNEVRVVAQRIKAHGARIGVATVLVSQISRPGKSNENAAPSKHALKEAGDLENMAEVVVTAWRDAESDKEPIKLRLVKSKWGGVGNEWRMQRTAHGLVEL